MIYLPEHDDPRASQHTDDRSRQSLNARKERILRAVIDDYILTALPVGSVTICRKYEPTLSSATIRNELSALEALGYLAQPHVSAGRVPSHKAYRLYVDALLQHGVAPLDEESVRSYLFSRIRQMEDVVASAAQALSEMTHYTALVMMPKQLELRISCLQLVPMPNSLALLVIITDGGIIRDSVIQVSSSLDADALYAISRMLTERLAGRTVREVQLMLSQYSHRMGADEGVCQGIADLASQMARQTGTDTVAVGGSHNILSYPEYADVEKARAFMSVMEEKERLLSLLSPDDAPLSVRIGSELGVKGMEDCSMVTAKYKVGTQRGAVSIIGPTRMPYRQMLGMLHSVGKALSELMGEDDHA